MTTTPTIPKVSKQSGMTKPRKGEMTTHFASLVINPSSLTVERGSSSNIKGNEVVVVSGTRGMGKSMSLKNYRFENSVVVTTEEVERLTQIIRKTLESVQEVKTQFSGPLAEPELLRRVAAALTDKAQELPSTMSPQEGWQELVEQGLRLKKKLLDSNEFKSTTEASELVGIGEGAIRKRIREGKLFALKNPINDEYRIPIWALDDEISGSVTQSVLREARTADSWHVYHFMTTPQGSLNGLRPFELLLSKKNISPMQRVARDELTTYLNLSGSQELLNVVLQALKADFSENA